MFFDTDQASNDDQLKLNESISDQISIDQSSGKDQTQTANVVKRM